MSTLTWVGFLAAAAVAAPSRYLIDGWVEERTGGALPWGTVTVNLLGCFGLGFLTGLGLHHGLGPSARTVLGTGGMGALTTFSTFSFETVRLAEEGDVDDAARNVAVNLLGGLAAAAVGLALATAGA
jgi:CrcB protein